MSRENLKELCENYFKLWASKDIDGLAKVFANNVTLQDWEITAKGIFKVLEANQKIFSSTGKLSVYINNLHYDPSCPWKVVCDISVTVNEGEDRETFLPVIDMISFNQDDQIDFIYAYRGF